MKNRLPGSYSELLQKAEDFTGIDLPDAASVLNRFKLNPGFSNLHSSLLYIVDYVQQQYLAVGPQCSNFIGYNTDYIKDAGPAFYTGLWHKNDFKIMNEQIFPESMQLLAKLPPEKHKELLFTFNYRIKTKKGHYLKFNQRSAYIAFGNNGTPLAAVGLVSNITSFKPDNNIVFIAEERGVNDAFTDNAPLLYQTYFPDEKDSILSDREIEILKWLCEGLSSQQVADKLFISINTVNNHRKNILRKTNARNIMEVVAYAVRNHIL